MANELRFTLREWWEEWKKLYHNNVNFYNDIKCDHCSGLKSEFLCNIHIIPQYQNYYVTHNVRITM